MLDDAKTEATRLIAADASCRNTVVVLIVAGGEGTTVAAATAATTAAKGTNFLNVSGRRVPVYVIAVAPPAADVANLQLIATNSGGKFVQITKANIDAVAAGTAVPEFVKAVNIAVQDAFERYADFNTAPTASLPYGPESEFQVTSPIIGTVNLAGALDIDGSSLPNTTVVDKEGNAIPQRTNVMVTSGFSLPGFEGRCGRSESTTDSGCDEDVRLQILAGRHPPLGRMRAGDHEQRAMLVAGDQREKHLYVAAGWNRRFVYERSGDHAGAVFERRDGCACRFRCGRADQHDPRDAAWGDCVVDAGHHGSAVARPAAGWRLSRICHGQQRSPQHRLDLRERRHAPRDRRAPRRRGLGVHPVQPVAEAHVLLDGQPVGKFDYLMDGSPKIADVKIDGAWKTYLIVGEGPGGTFYQTFDVTLPGMGATASPTDNTIGPSLDLLLRSKARSPLKWSFPQTTNSTTRSISRCRP